MNLRVGDAVVKGYRRADLQDAWSRYLPTIHAAMDRSQSPPPGEPLQPLQPLFQRTQFVLEVEESDPYFM